jgi:hypothetical protein
MRYVNIKGYVYGSGLAYGGGTGVRPAFVLDFTSAQDRIGGSGTKTNPYMLTGE